MARRLGQNTAQDKETRREKKTLRQTCQAALDALVLDEDGGSRTTRDAIIATLIAEALSGNLKAFEVLRDTAGEKPKDKAETSLSGGVSVSWKKS